MELGGGTQGDQSVLYGPSPCVAWKSALVCFAHLCKGEEGARSPSFPPPCCLVGTWTRIYQRGLTTCAFPTSGTIADVT